MDDDLSMPMRNNSAFRRGTAGIIVISKHMKLSHRFGDGNGVQTAGAE